MQLVELVAKLHSIDPQIKIALIGIIKQTGVGDDEGIIEFYNDYFNRQPIYKDEKWKLYHAMGGRKVGMLGLLKTTFISSERWKNKTQFAKVPKPWAIVPLKSKHSNTIQTMK